MLDLSKGWDTYPVLSVDFETTGPDPLTCEPVEVACIRFERGVEVARFATMLRTEQPIPAEATAVHGITDEMVAGMPTLTDVGAHIAEVAEGAVPLAYNRTFDRTIMHRYLGGEGLPVTDPRQPWLCTYALAWAADRYQKGKGRLKLTEVAKRRNIIMGDAHRALADAQVSGLLLARLVSELLAAKNNLDKVPTMAQVLTRVAQLEQEREDDFAAFQARCRAEERPIWRGYAAAALHGLSSLPWIGPGVEVMESRVQKAAALADAMLKAEKERYL